MVKLIILGVLVVAGVVAYKLWKAKKAVTGAAVVAGVETAVKTEVAAVETTVATDVAKKL
jgi:hypothetical protein